MRHVDPLSRLRMLLPLTNRNDLLLCITSVLLKNVACSYFRRKAQPGLRYEQPLSACRPQTSEISICTNGRLAADKSASPCTPLAWDRAVDLPSGSSHMPAISPQNRTCLDAAQDVMLVRLLFLVASRCRVPVDESMYV